MIGIIILTKGDKYQIFDTLNNVQVGKTIDTLSDAEIILKFLLSLK